MNLTKLIIERLKIMRGGAQPSSNNDLLENVICETNPCEQIGTGNFGEVYKGAYQEEGKYCYKRVGLKVLSKTDEKSKKEFEQEKKMAIILKGDLNVVNFYGEAKFPDDPTRRCLVFEYCKHGDLKKYLDPDPNKLNYDQKIKILKQICEGMEFIHKQKVLHRDLAARNILLDKDLIAKVGDFGLVVKVENNNNPNLNHKSTKSEKLPIRSLSPKFYKNNKTFNIQTDLWAFGVTIWEIFTQDRIKYNNRIEIEIPVPYKDFRNKDVQQSLMNNNYKLNYYTKEFKTDNDIVNDIIKQCFEPAFAEQNKEEDVINRNFTDLLKHIKAPYPLYNKSNGGSRKKKRTLKKGGRPKRKQSKTRKSRK